MGLTWELSALQSLVIGCLPVIGDGGVRRVDHWIRLGEKPGASDFSNCFFMA